MFARAPSEVPGLFEHPDMGARGSELETHPFFWLRLWRWSRLKGPRANLGSDKLARDLLHQPQHQTRNENNG